MHWRQREMLFEQTEALKGNLEEKRQPEYTGFGDKSPKMREPDSRVAAKSSKPRTGGGLQGPGKKRKKRRSFEAKLNEYRPMPRGAGKTRRKTGTTYQDQRLKTNRRGKAESHCEAYAEAYVRGVEAAMNESLLLEYSPIPPFMVEFTMGSLNRLQSAIANGETEFNVGSGYMLPVSLFLGRDGSINTFIVNQLFGANLSEFSDILGVDVPIIPPTGPSLDDPIFPPPGEPELPLTRDAILNPVSTTRQVTGYSRPNPPMPGGGGSAPFYPGAPGNFSRGGGKAGPM